MWLVQPCHLSLSQPLLQIWVEEGLPSWTPVIELVLEHRKRISFQYTLKQWKMETQETFEGN